MNICSYEKTFSRKESKESLSKNENKIKQNELKCEQCGAPLSEDNIYVRVINGEKHYFCCSHCADKFEAKSKRKTQ